MSLVSLSHYCVTDCTIHELRTGSLHSKRKDCQDIKKGGSHSQVTVIVLWRNRGPILITVLPHTPANRATLHSGIIAYSVVLLETGAPLRQRYPDAGF